MRYCWVLLVVVVVVVLLLLLLVVLLLPLLLLLPPLALTLPAQRFTPLHCAADQGHAGIVLLLLQKQAGVEGQDKDAYTPLHCAAQVREHSSAVERCGPHTAIAPAMLRSSDCALRGAGGPPAVRTAPGAGGRQPRGAQPLRQHPAEHRRCEGRGDRQLHVDSCPLCHVSHPQCSSSDLNTSLNIEARDNHEEVVAALLAGPTSAPAQRTGAGSGAGADPTAVNVKGATALHRACDKGNAGIAALLLDASSDTLMAKVSLTTVEVTHCSATCATCHVTALLRLISNTLAYG